MRQIDQSQNKLPLRMQNHKDVSLLQERIEGDRDYSARQLLFSRSGCFQVFGDIKNEQRHILVFDGQKLELCITLTNTQK